MQVIFMYHNNFLQNFKENYKQRKFNKLELLAKKINKNSHIKKLTIFVLGNLLYCEKALAESDVNLKKIDEAGWKLLGICRTVGFWVCVLMAINEIIRNLLQGDAKAIARIMMKYSLAFAALYMFPWILNIIRDIFS